MRKEPGDRPPLALRDGMGVLIVYCILILLVETNENDICLPYIEWWRACSLLVTTSDERCHHCRGKGTRSAAPVQELTNSRFPILGHDVGAKARYNDTAQ